MSEKFKNVSTNPVEYIWVFLEIGFQIILILALVAASQKSLLGIEHSW